MGVSEVFAVKDAVYKLQLALLDGIREEERLMLAGLLMCRGDYEDVVTERNILKLCGYPFCVNNLSGEKRRNGRYRVSLKEHKVFDLEEMDKYCSDTCVVNSRAFAVSLQEERSSDLNPDKIEKVMKRFEGLSLGSESEGSSANRNLGVSELRIQEKTDFIGGSMYVENLAGPSNAIEGYVPRRNRNPQPSQLGKQKKVTKAAQKAKQSSFFDDMNFTSCIITGDEYSVSKMPPSGMDADNQFTLFESSDDPSKRNVEKDKKVSNLEKKTRIKDKEAATKVGVGLISGPKTTEEEESADGISKLYESMHKSSLKSSGVRKLSRSVTWADDYGKVSLCEIEELGNLDISKAYDEKSVPGFASAEACAIALNQAAEAVASGEADVTDAVLDAGIIILPPDRVEGEAVVDNGMVELDMSAIKWPMKRDISESDILESSDSWLDPPPDGFSLELSPFATMFMSIFAWTTSSSLAYIYGQDESSHEEYMSVNGKEYPRKIILSDGQLSEIKQVLAQYLSRALPGLVAELRLHVPVSYMEKELSRLLETMTFTDALPSLRMKQWQLVTLLFLDALSVCRIPALQPIMTSQRILLHKVFENAQISTEEYEVMKDHMIPLGRTPQFSAQSGA